MQPTWLCLHLPPALLPARYEEGFEPYVIVSRKFVPWYDERFVGYRKNKVRGAGKDRCRLLGPGSLVSATHTEARPLS